MATNTENPCLLGGGIVFWIRHVSDLGLDQPTHIFPTKKTRTLFV